ncbi:hypothetical protein QBC44DRAFT_382278 [Cladorrhinum sp. PSN332]|nr:hypothetical protein QBC44DRAFT_382278 [Cladorrhinum sp. PSN332]
MESQNAKIIFGSILRPTPARTYTKKGKNRQAYGLPATEPTPSRAESKRKASSDPSALQVTKKRVRYISTQHEPRIEHSPHDNDISEEEYAIQVEENSQASIHLDNEISFLPEYSDPEEESSDGSDGIIDIGHSSPRRSRSSNKSSTPQSAGHIGQRDEVEEANEANPEQGDEKAPTPVSYHDHRRRPGRPFLHQYKGLRRRPYLIFNQTPSHRLKELPKSEKKKTIFASRTNLGDGFSDNEAKHSGLVLLTKNGRHPATGPNFGLLDVTQSRSPKGKPPVKRKEATHKRKGRRADLDDNSFQPLSKKLKKSTEREKANPAKTQPPQPPAQDARSSERTIVNSTVLVLPEAQERVGESLPEVTKNTAPQDNIEETNELEKEPAQDTITEEQAVAHPSSDGSIQFIIPNSDDVNLPQKLRRHRTIASTDPSCSWETYIPESSDMVRASSVPVSPTQSSPSRQEPLPPEQQQPSPPSLPLPRKLKKQVSFSLDTKARTPFHRALRRVNTQ